MIFFFSSRRRHTRSLCDWSQTCALPISLEFLVGFIVEAVNAKKAADKAYEELQRHNKAMETLTKEIGRASCRERVYKSGEAVEVKTRVIIAVRSRNHLK